MATSSSAKKAAIRVLSYHIGTRKIRTSISQIRKFSGFEDREHNWAQFADDHVSTKAVVWPDETMGPLNTPDFRFALPGNIGVTKEDKAVERNRPVDTQAEVLPEGIAERHLTVISQLIAESDYLDPDSQTDTDMADCILRKYFENARVELAMQDCPHMIYKDFASFFPDMPQNGKLTIVTITQRTDNDMSGWTESVDEEREKLLENFMSTATEICHTLKAHNYWCDYVDPSSGQPFFGPYTNTTFYETDERYRHLGFEIEDLGCCKVIYHKKWGAKVFVGSIFTMAPKEHAVMQNLLKLLD
uniref:cobalamin trafficking protein CblD-like n=1 Tax=Styela clava TaxID=7725 RepID=UPI00193A0EF4|nr:cobalamin trafficking protein CblD-like [Styela clava]